MSMLKDVLQRCQVPFATLTIERIAESDFFFATAETNTQLEGIFFHVQTRVR